MHYRHRVADTYAWVIEQEFVKVDKSSRNTEQWIFEQRVRFPDGQARWQDRVRRRMWEDMIQRFELEAERQEEERKRQKALNELGRREAREEFQRIQAGLREQKRLKAERAIIDAWKRYEQTWSSLASSLAFSDIPWPVVVRPTRPEDITLRNVSAFLLSPLHSPTQTAKERIKSAQLRWHPDRFQRILAKVRPSDKAAVEEAAGLVSRYLNDLMRQQ
ncbi:hypothetical protein VKT23_000902 [Stygiomarasmius scandens]|uniref:J domain-containing protein n=1 Tax=Marasmiellus scandens TaxID=2682957 RepID=A0ABR1K5Q3_9AGAR